ncbi:MAG: peptidoglycan-binding protein [Phycisphaerae bacterium]
MSDMPKNPPSGGDDGWSNPIDEALKRKSAQNTPDELGAKSGSNGAPGGSESIFSRIGKIVADAVAQNPPKSRSINAIIADVLREATRQQAGTPASISKIAKEVIGQVLAAENKKSGAQAAKPGPATGRGPVGSGEHVVRQGECIYSIAKDHGHFWETLWNEPQNADLRTARKSPNVLLPGDRVHIPPLRNKWEPGQSEMRHRFQRKGQPASFKMRVLRDGEARGNEPYKLDVDGTTIEGTTDADGKLSAAIAANARRVKMWVGKPSDVDEYSFLLGGIDPIEELSGVQGRLNNLGFDCGPIDGKLGPQTEKALKTYQGRRKLPVTGQPDEATRAKLLEDHGS